MLPIFVFIENDLTTMLSISSIMYMVRGGYLDKGKIFFSCTFAGGWGCEKRYGVQNDPLCTPLYRAMGMRIRSPIDFKCYESLLMYE